MGTCKSTFSCSGQHTVFGMVGEHVLGWLEELNATKAENCLRAHIFIKGSKLKLALNNPDLSHLKFIVDARMRKTTLHTGPKR